MVTITYETIPCPEGYATCDGDRADWDDAGPRRLVARVGEVEVGWISWFPYDEDGNPGPLVQKIWVDEPHRRNGIAWQLMDAFTARFPGDIVLGYLTDEGRAFFYRWRTLRTDVHRFITNL